MLLYQTYQDIKMAVCSVKMINRKYCLFNWDLNKHIDGN